MKLVLVTIGILVLVFVIMITRFYNKKNTTTKHGLPDDILLRIQQKFPNPKDREEVLKMMDEIKKDAINVGKEQLIRSILIIADKDKNKIRQIIDSKYYGDPRNIIIEAMEVPGNENDHGMTSFEKE